MKHTPTPPTPAGATSPAFTKRDIGIIIDESNGSADDCNERTIAFAIEHGFDGGALQGCFDGLRGLYITMTLDEARDCSHSGQCDDDVATLLAEPHICAQFDVMDAETIRDGLSECGAWSDDELADDAQNRLRALWQAACDLRENGSQQLSEIADDAVSFLNDLNTLPYCSFFFEDNSLFFSPCVENAREDVGFVSGGEDADPEDSDYPAADYEGEWLHVSDHGNATLYVREAGNDTEIWSVV